MRRLFVAGLLFVVACSKKDDAPKPEDKPADKTEPKPADPKPADPGVKPAEAPPAKIKEATNSGDLGKLPIDSELVFGVNVAMVQTSPIWKDFIAPRVMSDDVKAKLEEFKAKCGIDPLAVVKTASIGLKEGTAGKEGAVVVHGPEKAKVAACADKMKADKDAKVEITQDGEVTILKPKGGGTAVAYQFIGDTDAVIVIGPKADAAGVKSIVEGKSGLASSATFVDMYNRLETEKALWMLINGKNSAFKPLAMAGIKPTHVFGALDVSDGINLDMRMRLASADQATQSATMMKSQLAPAAGMLKIDKIDVGSDGPDLKLTMIVSKANIGPMLQSMQSMAKMAGGGGGGGAMGGTP
jgi:hypothetical protein